MVSNEVALQRERTVTITREVSLKLKGKPPSAYILYTWMAFQANPREGLDVFLKDYSSEMEVSVQTAKKAFAVLVDIKLVRVLRRYSSTVWKVEVYQYEPPLNGMNSLLVVTQEAKIRDRYTCQITGAKAEKSASRAIHAHHIYSRNEFEVISLELDNLICLADDVHRLFHAWNGGGRLPCNPDCLIKFIKTEYSETNLSISTIQRLEKVKLLYHSYVESI